MTATDKDIIYIDIDDEITGIIEKVQGAEHKIVALVLPKRAAVLQSVVNMKLLKRSAEGAKKNLVLITSEAGLMPLAGAVGLHVAKTLQTKPMIPTAPKIYDGNNVADDDEPVEAVADEPLDASKPIGLLAGLRSGFSRDDAETIEVDNSDEAAEALDEPVKKPHNKKLKVPNFDKFRVRLLLGGVGLVAILVFWYFAAFVMPRANIVIKTDTSSETADFAFTTDPKLTDLDLEERTLPSVVEKVEKADTEKVTATGEKDAGTKATGTITIRNCAYADGFTIAAGSTFTGSGKNFISLERVTVPEFSGGAGSCTLSGSSSGKASVDVRAAEAGESYNISATSYTVPGIPSSEEVDAIGTAMAGGTTKIVKVLSQDDFDEAKEKIEERADETAADELAAALKEKGYLALTESLVVGTPKYTAKPKVGEEATEATVTSSITYSMTGVKDDDFEALVEDNVKDDFDDNSQMLISTGLDKATVRLSSKNASGKTEGSLKSIVVIGPKLDIDSLKKEVAGKKKSEVIALLKDRPGVNEVTVDYSPFWVFSTPGKTGKITITLEQTESSEDN